MILFTILMLTLIVAGIAALISVIVGGIGFAVAFGDIFVFALIVMAVIKIIRKKKK